MTKKADFVKFIFIPMLEFTLLGSPFQKAEAQDLKTAAALRAKVEVTDRGQDEHSVRSEISLAPEICYFAFASKLKTTEEETSTLKIVPLTAIRLYKKLLSPGLGARCNLQPTCSTFGFEAIQRYGPLFGALMAADRLMRDHPFIQERDYPLSEDGCSLDPIEENYLWRK